MNTRYAHIVRLYLREPVGALVEGRGVGSGTGLGTGFTLGAPVADVRGSEIYTIF